MEHQPWKCKGTDVYKPQFHGCTPKRGLKLDITQQTSMLKTQQKARKEISRFVSALFFSSGYIASLGLANVVISVSILFLSPGDYLWVVVVNKPSLYSFLRSSTLTMARSKFSLVLLQYIISFTHHLIQSYLKTTSTSWGTNFMTPWLLTSRILNMLQRNRPWH